MKTLLLLLATLFSAPAISSCYQVLSPDNKLVWQDDKPPVPLDSLALDEQLARFVPNGHLVIIDDRTTPCRFVDTVGRKAENPDGQLLPSALPTLRGR